MTIMLVSKYLELQLTTALKPSTDINITRWNYCFSRRWIYSDFTARFQCSVLSDRQ